MRDEPKIAAIPNQRRYQQIAKVLIRHGFGLFLAELGLGRFIPFLKDTGTDPKEPHSKPEHLRVALEELGTTFIKLGQIMSTRADLLPPEYLSELAKLQAAVPVLPAQVIKEEIQYNLGAEVSDLFASFEETPLAAASIGQVHRASLANGDRVVIKVQRPGVSELVNADLEILRHLAHLVARRTGLGKVADLEGLVEEFSQILRQELNYIQEGRNADFFRENFQGHGEVYIPKVYWDYTTSRVIAFEEVTGFGIGDFQALDRAAINQHNLATSNVNILFKMIFEDGFFHADPHPGNMFVGPEGTLILVDFGMVGRLDASTRENLINLFMAASRRDHEDLVDILLEMGINNGPIDRQAVKKDARRFLYKYLDRPLREINMAHVTSELLNVAYRHKLQLPSNLAILAKTIMMSEGLGRKLDPDFNLVESITPLAQKLMFQYYSPQRIGRRIWKAAQDFGRLGAELPGQLLRLIRQINEGSTVMGMEPRNYEPILGALNRMVNRLSLSILTAALIVGLSLVVPVYKPAGGTAFMGWAFTITFVAVTIMGISLFIAIWRSGRK